MRSCVTGAVLFLLGCGAAPRGTPAIAFDPAAPAPPCVVATGELAAAQERERAACRAWATRICSDCGRRWPECGNNLDLDAACASETCEARSIDEVLENAAMIECRVAAPTFGNACDIDDRGCGQP